MTQVETDIKGRCWNCGAGLESADYGRENSCLSCGKPTRVCRNCRWYRTGRPNECEEPMAERVLDKERANYCEYFEPTRDAHREPDGAPSPEDLREAAEDLFKF